MTRKTFADPSQTNLFALFATIDHADQRITQLVRRGALFVINHSGGKDSQAMLIEVRRYVPDHQIVIVHADLPEVDWEGIDEHIAANSFGLPVTVCRAKKTFFAMVEGRQMFPSPQYRQCTSDLKRTPIECAIRRISRERGKLLIVNCMGLRAAESTSRAKLETLKLNDGNSKAGREWYDWLPIHSMTTEAVFATIAAAGQQPHPVYAMGMTRLSCCFCIMASKADLQTAARLRPALYARYVATERKIDQSMMMPAAGVRRFLPEITGIAA